MILLQEKISEKLPQLTSIFISFDYNKDIVECVKSIGDAIYEKKTKCWELPISKLHTAIDKLSKFDELKLQFLEEIKKEDSVYELDKFKTEPFPYQKEAIQYALNHDKFMLLDGMGLGKSLQSIYAAQEIKKYHDIEHCLVICGVNTLKSNWKREIELHSDLDCIILGEKKTKTGKTVIGSVQERLEQLKNPIKEFFVITNIETLRNDDIIKEINKSKVNKFDMIIFDEMHKAKSNSSQQGKNLLKLKNAKFKIGLTGTLLLNSPFDSFVPLSWLDIIHCSKTNFEHFFGNYGGVFNNDLIGYRNTDSLKEILDTCSLRRTKDILDLPPKVIVDEFIDLNDDQKAFYENLKQGIKEQVDKVELNTSTLLGMVTRFRQATVCPSILTTENISSSKLDRAKDLSEQIVEQGDKVVIFSTFKESLNLLLESLKQYNPVLCTGDTKDADISVNIDKFMHDESIKVMLCTWQKMGTGVTLTAASYAIFLDIPWTQSLYEQAQDRIYRIGTQNSVVIYNLVCTDTIDERVLEIVNSKKAMSDFIIDDIISEESLSILRKYITDL